MGNAGEDFEETGRFTLGNGRNIYVPCSKCPDPDRRSDPTCDSINPDEYPYFLLGIIHPANLFSIRRRAILPLTKISG